MMVDNWTVRIGRSRGASGLRLVVRSCNLYEMVEEVSWWRDARRWERKFQWCMFVM